MSGDVEMVVNAVGRRVPTMVNGVEALPFQGVGGHDPKGPKRAPPIRSSQNYPASGDKRVPDLKTALELCGLSDGMVISTHHHLRNGDRVALLALQTAAEMGLRDLMWFPSASFPCQEPVIDLMERGVVHHIEGSMNGPLGRYCSQGKMSGLGVLRSHGGRWQAIQDGEVKIDVAVIAAPTADAFGNADGSHGPSACGSLGFALADSIYAERVIVVTDNLVDFPCIPSQIQGNNVDFVVEVDSIGDPSKIVSGTTQITKSPDRHLIAENVAKFLRDAGIMRDGFSFQAGAGGIALAFVQYLRELMLEAGVKARFARGGSTEHLVGLLNEGLVGYVLDGQTFDLAAVESIASNPRHVATTPFTSYNHHGKGNFATFVDAAVLGATEVDASSPDARSWPCRRSGIASPSSSTRSRPSQGRASSSTSSRPSVAWPSTRGGRIYSTRYEAPTCRSGPSTRSRRRSKPSWAGRRSSRISSIGPWRSSSGWTGP
jgi:citrate lyase subunit alpha/citrate CoA-transferase